MSNCTYESFQSTTDKCALASAACSGKYFNPYTLHYCNLNEALYFSLPILLLIFILCFYMLSTTANRYLSSSLTLISDKLKISQNFAALTFLAFGNGAPDVISSVVASDSGGLEMTIGALLGAGCFVTTLVFSLVIFYAKEVNVIGKMYVRDIAIYFISLAMITYFAWDGKIHLYESIIFFSLYFIYLIIALIQEKKKVLPFTKALKIKTQDGSTVKSGDEYDRGVNSNNTNSSNSNELNEEQIQELMGKNVVGIIDYTEKKEGVMYTRNTANTENLINTNKTNINIHSIPENNNITIIRESSIKESVNLTQNKINNISNSIIKEEDIENHQADDKKFASSAHNEDLNHNNNNTTNTNNSLDLDLIRKDLMNHLLKEDHFDSNSMKLPKNPNKNSNAEDTNQNNTNKISKKENIDRKRVHFLFKSYYSAFLYRVKRHYFNHREMNWNKMSILGKISHILIELPLTFLRDLTIPAVELPDWNQTYALLCPFFSALFIISALNLWKSFISTWYIPLITGIAIIVCIIAIKLTTYRNKLPKYIIPVCIYSFFMSIFWIWTVSNIVVDILNFLGVLFNLSAAFLGLTLLALGNSAPDLSLDVALAKIGYGEMAVAGTIAGPLFNLLIGLGISLIKSNIKKKTHIEFNFMNKDNRTNFIALIVLASNFVMLLILAVMFKFKMTKFSAYCCMVLFCVYFVLILVFTFAFN